MHNNICPENIRIDASRHLVLVNFEVADLPGESSVQPDFDSDYSGTVGRNKERAYKALEVLLSWTRDSVVDALGFGMVLHWMVTSRVSYSMVSEFELKVTRVASMIAGLGTGCSMLEAVRSITIEVWELG